MELELNNDLGEGVSQKNGVEEFCKELSNSLQKENISEYYYIVSLYDKKYKTYNLTGFNDAPCYGYSLVQPSKLPKNIKVGTVLRVDEKNNYVIDSELTRENLKSLEGRIINKENEIDNAKLTRDTDRKIETAISEIIQKNIKTINSDDKCIYLLGNPIGTAGGYNIDKYEEGKIYSTDMKLNYMELPENVQKGDTLIKVNGEYKKIESIANEIVNAKIELLKEQEKFLKSCRIDGTTYKVEGISDSCTEARANLINKETGQEFEEIEISHELYHQIGYKSELEYKNGKYTVLEGTSVEDLYPNNENYCEIDGSYSSNNIANLIDGLVNKNQNKIATAIRRITC